MRNENGPFSKLSLRFGLCNPEVMIHGCHPHLPLHMTYGLYKEYLQRTLFGSNKIRNMLIISKFRSNKIFRLSWARTLLLM